MIINVGDYVECNHGRSGTIINIGIATEKTDIAAEADTSLNAKTYDTELGYTGAITYGSNWCYFSQIDKVLEKNNNEEDTDWMND
jgi:hypothetical protein